MTRTASTSHHRQSAWPGARAGRVSAIAASIASVCLAAILLVIHARTHPALAASLQAGAAIVLASALGAAPVLALRRLDDALRDALMGFGAGVMLGASFFTLLLPALAEAKSFAGSPVAGVALVATGLVAGAIVMFAADRTMPHEHLRAGRHGLGAARIRRAWLIATAIALHHLPEGLAVGAGYAAGPQQGLAMALGIGLQSVPEGLVVAASLRGAGYGRRMALLVATLTGLTQPLGAALGALAGTGSPPAAALMTAFAAGAMIFVVSHEVVPESHRSGHQGAATLALVAGLVVMLACDQLLA